MPLMTWNSSLSVGVRALDQQHLRLVDTLNELHDAMKIGKANHITGPLLKSLTAYTRDHFAAEEALLNKTRYPKLAEHRLKHRNLTTEVESYVVRLDRGEMTLGLQLLSFLKAWLTSHIMQEDREYGAWLNQHGID